MKRLLFLSLIFSLFSISAFGDIAVKSFRKLENDMDARVGSTVIKDFNGDPSAIIKVVTTQIGFSFDAGQVGIVKTVNNPSEIWVYIPYGAKRLTISHPQLGLLRDYIFPVPIEKATVYEMVLITGKVETVVVEEEIASQWLVISPTPDDAAIYIDDIYIKNGAYQVKQKPGSYTYRVESPMYHSEGGKIEVKDKKVELSVNLKPAFGYFNITSTPESGATIIIDGKSVSGVTPFKSDRIMSGEHTIQVMKEMYQPSFQKVTLTDGQTLPVNFILVPNFGEVTVTAPNGTTILMNNQQKGTSTWRGRLLPGVYSFEGVLKSHRADKRDMEVSAGEKYDVTLSPTPIYGSLDIMTEPHGATVTVDGKNYGTTPTTISKLLIGDYTVNLTKSGYSTINRQVTIMENRSAEVNERMENGKNVTITSTPEGVNLYIDNVSVGTTPYSGHLLFGTHILGIEKDGKKSERRVEIQMSGGETDFVLDFGPTKYFETVNGVKFGMVEVKGGTFMMGSPSNESGRDNDEVQHQVTLKSFIMGTHEVTQGLWKAVMGNNPSNFNGDNLPVESVSWNNVQEFIKKLNQLTGKKYRLPTEAEWEYACRGGSTTAYCFGDNSNSLGDYAWYDNNSGNRTHEVGTKKPNAWGLYDMHGNVLEWCNDWEADYPTTPQKDPTGPSSGSNRVFRGGGWYGSAQGCRSAFRNRNDPDYRGNYLGFRIALSL